MYIKTINYTDYNGNTRTEDHYFNLTEAEALEMEMSTNVVFLKELRESLLLRIQQLLLPSLRI